LILLSISAIIDIHYGIVRMNIQQLLQHLKHGYTYSVTNEAGETYQMLAAPNKHMIKASEVRVGLIGELERMNLSALQNSKLLAEAFGDCERLTKELDDAKKTIQDQLRNSVNGDPEGDAKGSSN